MPQEGQEPTRPLSHDSFPKLVRLPGHLPSVTQAFHMWLLWGTSPKSNFILQLRPALLLAPLLRRLGVDINNHISKWLTNGFPPTTHTLSTYFFGVRSTHLNILPQLKIRLNQQRLQHQLRLRLSENKTRMSLLPHQLDIELEGLARATREEQEVKGIQIGKKK